NTYTLSFFFFNDTATTEIYTLSLHDALPISCPAHRLTNFHIGKCQRLMDKRSEEHTSELQSRSELVCRLLLEKKKNNISKKQTNKNKQTYKKQKSQITLK